MHTTCCIPSRAVSPRRREGCARSILGHRPQPGHDKAMRDARFDFWAPSEPRLFVQANDSSGCETSLELCEDLPGLKEGRCIRLGLDFLVLGLESGSLAAGALDVVEERHDEPRHLDRVGEPAEQVEERDDV